MCVRCESPDIFPLDSHPSTPQRTTGLFYAACVEILTSIKQRQTGEFCDPPSGMPWPIHREQKPVVVTTPRAPHQVEPYCHLFPSTEPCKRAWASSTWVLGVSCSMSSYDGGRPPAATNRGIWGGGQGSRPANCRMVLPRFREKAGQS